MMVKRRRRHTAAYKFRIALEAVEASKPISQLSSEHMIRLKNLHHLPGRTPHSRSLHRLPAPTQYPSQHR